jgi:hypothetical protein
MQKSSAKRLSVTFPADDWARNFFKVEKKGVFVLASLFKMLTHVSSSVTVSINIASPSLQHRSRSLMQL